MVRALAVVGLVLMLAGVGLFFGYYPMTGKTSAQLKAREKTDSGVAYDGFREGDQIVIYGQITKISYNPNSKETSVQMDFVDITPVLGVPLNFIVTGDATQSSKVQDNVQMKAHLESALVIGGFKIQVWRVSGPGDIAPMLFYQAIFGGVAVVGLLLAVVGMARRRGAVPQAPPR